MLRNLVEDGQTIFAKLFQAIMHERSNTRNYDINRGRCGVAHFLVTQHSIKTRLPRLAHFGRSVPNRLLAVWLP